MNPEVKDGDSILGKTVLLNLEKMNKCVFYPIKHNLTLVNCNFIGGKDGLKGELLKQFNLMIYRDELSVIVWAKTKNNMSKS